MSPTVWHTSKGDVEGRLDAEFYLPKHLEIVRRVRAVGASQLGDIEVNGSYGVLPKSEEYGTGPVPLVRGGDLTGMPLTAVPDDAPRVPAKYLANKRGRLGPEEVLLLVKGATIDAPQSVGIVPASWNTPAVVNGSVYKFRVRTLSDPHFVAAFFGTPFGLSQNTRAIANTGINYNDQDSIRAFWVPQPDPDIQRAIGNKLRKAERLRDLAAAARLRLDQWIEGNAAGHRLSHSDRPFLDHSPSSTIRDWSWVTSVPTADRIDPWPHHVAPRTIRGHLEQHGRTTTLAKLAKRITDSRPRVEFTDPNQPGHYVSVLDVDSDGRIDWNNARVSRYAGSGYELQPGDILYSRINPRQPRVAAIRRSATGLLVGSPEFVILKPLTSLFGHPNLLAAVFRSGWVRVQATFLTRSSSLSRRRIDEEDLDQILVPWSDDRLDEMEAIAAHALDGDSEANGLVAAAKSAVEDLIDGTLDEANLLAESDAIERWLAENPSPSKGA